MIEFIEIPLDRRVWELSRMCELREQLDYKARRDLLQKISTLTWTEWNDWLLANLPKVATYATGNVSLRKRLSKQLGDDALLVHHASMFLTGLLYLAKQDCFPHEQGFEDQFNYDAHALAACLRIWNNIEMQSHCSLFWQFDEPSLETHLPFKD